MTRSLACIVALLTCAAASAGAQVSPATGRLVEDTIHARSLIGNRYGDSPDRLVVVYLPPSYAAAPARHYPVIYLLHGFDSGARTWLRMPRQGFVFATAMDSVIASGAVREMIVVMPDTHTRLGGAFYTNSATSGNWDDFIATELVAFVDGRYRTIARPDSRGLAGHSMGGYGALAIGMRHAGSVYGAVYSMSPCCTSFRKEDGVAMQGAWAALAAISPATGLPPASSPLRAPLALAAALSPDGAHAPTYADLPFVVVDGRTVAVDSVFRRWSAGAADDILLRYRDAVRQLRGLAMDVGTRDREVSPAAVAAMDTALTRSGIVHTFETFDGDHTDHIGQRLTSAVFPFFSRTLVFP